MYNELNLPDAHSPLSDSGVWILERDECVRVCVFMRVETVKVHWTGLTLLTLTGGELLKKLHHISSQVSSDTEAVFSQLPPFSCSPASHCVCVCVSTSECTCVCWLLFFFPILSNEIKTRKWMPTEEGGSFFCPTPPAHILLTNISWWSVLTKRSVEFKESSLSTSQRSVISSLFFRGGG